MSLREKVFSGLRWTAGGRLASQLFTWAVTLVVIRLLTPSDYGLLSMATIFVQFLQLTAEIGLGPAIVQAKQIEERQLKQIFGLILLINIGLCLLLFLLAPLIASFFSESRLTAVVQVMGLQFLALAITVIPKSLLERSMDFKRSAILDVGATLLGGVVTLLMALGGFGVWALVWGSLVGAIYKAIAINLVAPFFQLPSFRFDGTARLLLFGGNVTAARLLWFFYSQADVFIVGKLLGKDLLGIYSVSMHLAGLPVQRISGIINQVAMPAFAKLQHDPLLAGAHFLKAARLMLFAVFPVLWGMSAVAPELVGLVMGENWSSAVLPLQLLTLLMPLRMLSNMLPSLTQGLGRPDIALGNLVSASIIMPVAFFIGAGWGVVGVACAWLLAFPLVFLGNLYRALPLAGLKVRTLLASLAGAFAASLLMYAAVYFTRLSMPDWALVVRLPMLIAIGALAYVAASWWLNRTTFVEMLAMLRGKK